MTHINKDNKTEAWAFIRTDKDGQHHILSLLENDVVELVKLWIEQMIDITSDCPLPSVVIIRTNHEGTQNRLRLTGEDMAELVRMWAERL